jgi:hypothetical protein
VSFDGTPVAAAPPAEAAPPATPPATRRPAPRREAAREEPAQRRDVEPAPQRREVERPRVVHPPIEARRRPAPAYEEEEDDVIIYRSPRPRYEQPRGRGTVVYGPNGPVVVYPGQPVRPWGGWAW